MMTSAGGAEGGGGNNLLAGQPQQVPGVWVAWDPGPRRQHERLALGGAPARLAGPRPAAAAPAAALSRTRLPLGEQAAEAPLDRPPAPAARLLQRTLQQRGQELVALQELGPQLKGVLAGPVHLVLLRLERHRRLRLLFLPLLRRCQRVELPHGLQHLHRLPAVRGGAGGVESHGRAAGSRSRCGGTRRIGCCPLRGAAAPPHL
jgi:hypothetical protein